MEFNKNLLLSEIAEMWKMADKEVIEHFKEEADLANKEYDIEYQKLIDKFPEEYREYTEHRKKMRNYKRRLNRRKKTSISTT